MSNPWPTRPIPPNSRQRAVDLAAERLGAPRPYTSDHEEAAQVRELARNRQAGSRVALVRYGPRTDVVVGTLLEELDGRVRIATAELPHGAAYPTRAWTLIDLPPELEA